jgi:hypothetical protein
MNRRGGGLAVPVRSAASQNVMPTQMVSVYAGAMSMAEPC